jgi:hypothetical protein
MLFGATSAHSRRESAHRFMKIGPHISDSFNAGQFMKYLVMNHFGGGSDWTPDKLAAALKTPLGQVGVNVELTRGHISGGFQAVGLSGDAYKQKYDEVGRIVRLVMSAGPRPNSIS